LVNMAAFLNVEPCSLARPLVSRAVQPAKAPATTALVVSDGTAAASGSSSCCRRLLLAPRIAAAAMLLGSRRSRRELRRVARRINAGGQEVGFDAKGRARSGIVVADFDKNGGQVKAYRMPLPPDVDEIKTPRWSVLCQAVENCSAEDAVIPDWKLKPMLWINSPTPQYQPLTFIEPKAFWKTAHFLKSKLKKYYRKQLERRMLEDTTEKKGAGHILRYLPSPKERLSMAGTDLLGAYGSLKVEHNSWKELKSMSADEILAACDDQKTLRLAAAAKDIPIHWRPGYQTAAIRDMQKYLCRIDVVVEIRDARIPWASTHPDIPGWIRPRPRVIVLTHADKVQRSCIEETIQYFNQSENDRGVPVIPVDARDGTIGIEELRTELLKAGAYVNRRRKRKGINPRAIRTIMFGFPNTGKSSLINRLAGRKVAKRESKPGMTRKMTWHKIGGYRNTELEFLDAPGFIPVGFGRRFTPEQQSLLCICKCFSDKHLDRTATVYDLVYRLDKLVKEHPRLLQVETLWRETKRAYGVDFKKALRQEGPLFPDWVPSMNPDPYCGRLLGDFLHGVWGKIQLEPPPQSLQNVKELNKLLTGSKETRKHLATSPVKGALGPGQSQMIMPTKQDEQREKVPVMVRSKNLTDEGLFDGW